MTNLLYYKEVGCYLTLIKWKGRWYYGHESGRDHLVFLNSAKENGYTPKRLQGSPPRVAQKLVNKHGATIGTWKNNLPLFKNEWMVK